MNVAMAVPVSLIRGAWWSGPACGYGAEPSGGFEYVLVEEEYQHDKAQDMVYLEMVRAGVPGFPDDLVWHRCLFNPTGHEAFECIVPCVCNGAHREGCEYCQLHSLVEYRAEVLHPGDPEYVEYIENNPRLFGR